MVGRFLKDIIEGTLSLLFPPRCEICDTLQEPVLCEQCSTTFDSITPPYCEQCGLPFDPLAKTPGHCVDCRNDPPLFDAARAAGLYSDSLRRAIHLLKYDGVRALATPLAAFMADTISLPFAVSCLCPVPLHPAREAMRGYNQSGLLAEEFSQRLDIPVAAHLLARIQNTPPQISLPADERKRNVRGAFQASGEARGQTIALIDDVFTTGSTLRECSRVLKRAGAGRILVLTVARTMPDFR